MTRFSFTLLYVALVTLLYWLLYGQPGIGMDDANIYFTYAKNLVNGHGFVYYPGGEQVEGFTSFLWTLIVALFYFISPANFTMLIMGLCVVLVAISLHMCLTFIRRKTGATSLLSPQEVLFLLLLTLIPGYIDWTVLSLMETGIWSLFIVAITLRVASGRIHSGNDRLINAVLLALFVVLRPESLLWCFVFIGLIFIRHWQESAKFGRAFLKVLPVGVAVLVTMAALTLFRLNYFGYPLPNTYYAKVSADLTYNLIEGVRYIIFSCIQSPMLLLVLAAAAVSLIMLSIRFFHMARGGFKEDFNESEWVQLVLTVITGFSILIPIYVGGDHFKLLRFLQPFFPLYYLLFFNLPFWRNLIDVRVQMRPLTNFMLVLLVVPFIYASTGTPLHTYIQHSPPLDWEFELAELGRKDAEMIDSMFSRLQEPPSVGVSAAGGFGYAYNGVVYDLMGLNNAKMAHALEVKTGIKNHAAFDKKVFFQMKPDVFHGYFKTSAFVYTPDEVTLLENEPDFEEAYVSRMYKQLFADPDFIATYKPVLIGERVPYLKTYVNVEFFEKLKSSGYKVVELPRKGKGQQLEGQQIKVGSVY